MLNYPFKNCSICDNDKNLITHHLSYEPEITVIVCHRCHTTMHQLSRMAQNQRNIINDWVNQYGNLWESGNEKYRKSEHFKNRTKEYNNTDRRKNFLKEYQKEYHKTDKYKNYQKKYNNTDKCKNQRKKYQKEHRRIDEYKNHQKKYNKEYYLKKIKPKNIMGR